MGFDIFGNLNKAISAPQVEQIQSEALNRARKTQQGQYDTNKGYYNPYYQRGTQAMQSLGNNLDSGAYNTNVSAQDMQSDPGFQFRMDQGQKALERSAAAHGGLMSGGFMKGLADYSQGLASQEYGNVYNRKFQQNQFNYNALANMAGMGERAAGNLAGLGQNYGNTMAGYDMGMGNIHAGALTSMMDGAGGFADGSMGMGVAAATGSMGGGMGAMGSMGGRGSGLSAGNPYSMQPLGGESMGAIPTQSMPQQGGYGAMGGGFPHDPYGSPYGYGSY